MQRRSFMKSLTAATVVAPTALSWSRVDPSNDSLRIAVVGTGGRGRSLIGAVKSAKNCELVAVADVDENVLGKTEEKKSSLIRVQDFRKILDRKDVDAIVSATPNHWHALVTVLACQAGKHVYIEKPISHNMWECSMINAASDHNKKLVQCGFQNRSETGLQEFYGRLSRGDFGKVQSVLGTCHRKRGSIGKRDTPLSPPKHVNYDLWLGPAAEKDIMRKNFHYDWHWDFNTGNGDVGNQGPHEWDMINWSLSDLESAGLLPTKMVSAGNRFGWNDAGNTPNVMACVGLCRDVPIYFEVMDLNPGARAPDSNGVGVIINTEQGKFVGSRGGGRFEYKNGIVEKFNRAPSQKNHDGTRAHMQNFVDCVINNDRSKLRSDCRVATVSSSMAHMANVSYQMGESASADEVEAVIAKSELGKQMLNRLRKSVEIFAKKNAMNSTVEWVLGQALEFDNESQKFVGANSEAANQMMTREYRKGFEFPSIG